MAAIDKIYVKTYEEYIQFKEWCEKQPALKDKYGKEVKISAYLYTQWDKECWKEGDHPVVQAPYYVDAYIIRNCPLDFIQRELMINYGYKTQEDINKMYDFVINRSEEDQKLIDEANGKYPNKPISYWWLTLEDFKIVDGVITMPNRQKSAYEEILEGTLYNSPISNKYVRGKHFKMIKIPVPYGNRKCNYPIPVRNKKGIYVPYWEINIELPEYVEEYMWFSIDCRKPVKNAIGTWDFSSEFVYREWASSAAYCKSIDGLKRRLRKWNLPVGTIVKARGRYEDEEYQFIIKK